MSGETWSARRAEVLESDGTPPIARTSSAPRRLLGLLPELRAISASVVTGPHCGSRLWSRFLLAARARTGNPTADTMPKCYDLLRGNTRAVSALLDPASDERLVLQT